MFTQRTSLIKFLVNLDRKKLNILTGLLITRKSS